MTDLLARVARGDQRAWTTVVDRYADLVAGVPRCMRLSAADCDDVSQNTWLALLENAASIREPDRLDSWLRTVARREALRLLRRAGRQIPVSDQDYFDRMGEPAEAADGPVMRTERHAMLHTAIESLSGRGRHLVQTLLENPNASYVDVAAHVGIPVGSVGPTWTRSARRLRTALG